MNKKKYYIPLDLQEVFDEYNAYIKAKEILVDSWFNGYRRTIKASRMAEKLRIEFWRKVLDLYPELSGKKFHYRDIEGVVVEDD